jgi:glycosyltransferase involved in cell wall biosynthesis
LKILLLNTDDFNGGAAIACRRLLKALRFSDVMPLMLVQESKSKQDGVIQLNNSWLSKKMAFLLFVGERLYFLPDEKSKAVRFLFNPAKFGIDITKNNLVQEADVVHLHWTNFGFLSTDSLQQLFATGKPVVWTLHDMWAFTGGCHHSDECENYQEACGNCTQYIKKPGPKDLSNAIWKAKQEAFKGANLTVVTCSRWLGNRAKKSSLFQHVRVESIPNPIDVSVFSPLKKEDARKALGLNPAKHYILFAAMRVDAVGKGFAYFKAALELLHTQLTAKEASNIELLIFGQAEATDFDGLPFKANLLGRLTDLTTIAQVYSAASMFVIPSLAENLPNTIMEAMACGTPSVGFDVGGIPEMIVHQESGMPPTGYLAQYKSSEDLAKGMQWILSGSNYQQLCTNARQKVLDEYSEQAVSKRYYEVYESMASKGEINNQQVSPLWIKKPIEGLFRELVAESVPPLGARGLVIGLTIITITYNAEEFLERTIKSIVAQTNQDFEYIIIDGNSKDKTLDIAKRYESRVNRLISEPDKGLYDAMNKGLKAASGDFVWFMNAGDEIYDPKAVERICQRITDETDVLYGDTYFVDNEGNQQGLRSEITPHRLPKDLTWRDMNLGMLVCHQAFIARKTVAPLYMENNLSADVDWEISCLKKARKIQYLDFVVANYLTGGISNKQLKRSLLDRYEVLKKHFGFVGAVMAHVKILTRGISLIIKNRGKYW